MRRKDRYPTRTPMAPPRPWTTTAPGGILLLAASAWLLSITGAAPELGNALGRVAVPLLPLAVLSAGTAWLVDARRRPPETRRLRLALAGALAAALCVRWIGIEHEVGERSWLDEGTYYRYATGINDGELLPRSFVYPHLLYYADAFALWSAERMPGDETLARLWTGTEERLAHHWLWLRLVTALLSAATVLPVFGIGVVLAAGDRRVASGLAAAAFYVLSPLFNEGSHLFIADFPSACLATASLFFVARLVVAEGLRDYALAGVFAGLAAATKYPAGTVALAIPAVWLLHRLRSRARPHHVGALALATAAAIVAFLGSMPGFFRAPVAAISGPRGMLFGLRQYAEGGWIGVQPESHAGYYLGLLAGSFGAPALVLIVAAPWLARGERRRRLLWMLPFPLAYFGLVVSMNMVVKRNLAPVVPILAAFAGLGLVLLIARLAALRTGAARRALAAAACVVALALPAWATAIDAIGHARASTREEAARRIGSLLPIGATLVKESYTPRLDPSRLLLWNTRFYPRIPRQQIVDGGVDYLLLSSSAFARFLRDDQLLQEHHDENARRYREVLDGWEAILEVRPGRTQRGPALFLYRVPVEAPPATRLDLAPATAWVSARDMRHAPEAPIRFTGPDQWAVSRGHLAAGRYRVELRERGERARAGTEPPVFRAVSPDGRALGELGADPRLELAADGAVLFQVRRAPGTELDGLVVEPVAGPAVQAPQ
ncbi:MAG TPA: glycosyltransferase family 39 protein [Thermoanaerobaculia bacterium]|nr:glycosyltransferase family 39 protein [Thermoanaerobaculia bacterium]